MRLRVPARSAQGIGSHLFDVSCGSLARPRGPQYNRAHIMKDVTATSFGLVIAYLLPGVAGLYVLSFWSPDLGKVFDAFLKAQSNVGLFFLLTLAALLVGLEVTLLRWLIFEKWFSPVSALKPADFDNLKTEDLLAAFRGAVDEHYRYHQFWGNMAIVLPFAVITTIHESVWSCRAIFAVLFLVILEGITCIAAREAYRHYVNRARAILGK